MGVNAYLRARNAIAKEYGAVELKAPVSWRGDYLVNSDLRSDGDGLRLLEKFKAKMAKIDGPRVFADDGEAIVIWRGTRADVVARWRKEQDAKRAKVSRYAWFHPGYLPVKRPPQSWRALRVQNPNPCPYYRLNDGTDWLWCIYYDPAKIHCDILESEFRFTVAGVLTTAHIKLDRHYGLPSPYVTTQTRMDQILEDVAEYRRKLEIVQGRHEAEKPMESDHKYDRARRRLWFNLA